MKVQDEAKERCAGYLAFCVTAWLMALIDQRAEVLFVVFASSIVGLLTTWAMQGYHAYLDHLAEHLPERVKARQSDTAQV